jgi:hypothetical protein
MAAEAKVDEGEQSGGVVATAHGVDGDRGGSGGKHVLPDAPPKDGARTDQGFEQSSHKLNSHAKPTGHASGHHQKFD